MLRPSLPRVVLAFVPVLAGCSALINPDTDLLGTDDGTDSGVTLMDSGVMGVDAGPMGIDAGDRPCVEGTRSCAGDQLVSCVGGMEVPQDCQSMEAFCDVDHCTPHVCVPNSRECSADGTSVVSCNGRGSEAVAESCGDARCDPATRTCVGGGPECPRSTATIRIGGTYRIGLCTPDDSDTFVPDGRMCTGTSRADSGDRVFTLTLDAPTRVTLELTDIDERRAVDTILYVRRNCDDPSSQILCADDVPCAASTAEPAA
ncbi:MAG: hypothetical protein KC619_25525, partial [Myxococcales bacterium]|nr:hypothetical protein [Myxococcales bacterium]